MVLTPPGRCGCHQPMTDSQASFAREAFELWDDLIAINLTETTDWSDVDISIRLFILYVWGELRLRR